MDNENSVNKSNHSQGSVKPSDALEIVVNIPIGSVKKSANKDSDLLNGKQTDAGNSPPQEEQQNALEPKKAGTSNTLHSETEINADEEEEEDDEIDERNEGDEEEEDDDEEEENDDNQEQVEGTEEIEYEKEEEEEEEEENYEKAEKFEELENKETNEEEKKNQENDDEEGNDEEEQEEAEEEEEEEEEHTDEETGKSVNEKFKKSASKKKEDVPEAKILLLPRDRDDTVDTDDQEEGVEEFCVAEGQMDQVEEAREKKRQELLEVHKKLLERRRQAGELNIQLQTKLSEYFRRKKADAAETSNAGESSTSSMVDNAIDFAQRYAKYIATLTEIRKQFLNKKIGFDEEIELISQKCNDQQKEASKRHQEVINCLTSQCKKSVSVRTGRPVVEQEYLPLINLLIRKDTLVSNVRLESIKLVNEVEKIEAIFKSQEDLVEGLHLIDFEQLKIENQTYNEKIEERNEELGKLRRKIVSNVQMMTHIKEKLHYCQGENHVLRQQLEQATMMLNRNRDRLTKVKQNRDSLRGAYVKLQRSCGLLGNPQLLRNFEASMDEAEANAVVIMNLKNKTAKYLARANAFKEKLEAFHGKSDKKNHDKKLPLG